MQSCAPAPRVAARSRHPPSWGRALLTSNLGLLYYYWGVFTFLKRWVYIDLDRMSFFKRCAITSFENGLPTLDWY